MCSGKTISENAHSDTVFCRCGRLPSLEPWILLVPLWLEVQWRQFCLFHTSLQQMQIQLVSLEISTVFVNFLQYDSNCNFLAIAMNETYSRITSGKAVRLLFVFASVCSLESIKVRIFLDMLVYLNCLLRTSNFGEVIINWATEGQTACTIMNVCFLFIKSEFLYCSMANQSSKLYTGPVLSCHT